MSSTGAIFLVGLLVVLGVVLFVLMELGILDDKPKTIDKRERSPKDKRKLCKALNYGRIGEPLVFYGKKLGKSYLKNDPFRESNKLKDYTMSCEKRAIVFGISGSGKTNYIISQIYHWMRSGKSFVVTDIKPEIFGIVHTNNALEHFGYEPIIINPTDPFATPYNMLNDISMLDDISEESGFDELANILIPSENSGSDDFSLYGRLIFKATYYHLKEEDLGEPLSLTHIYKFLLKDEFRSLIDELSESNSPKAKQLEMQSRAAASSDRFAGLALGKLFERLSFLGNEVIAQNQKGDLSLKQILTERNKAIFLQFEQGHMASTERLYSATVQVLINLLMANADGRDDVLLLLDEIINGGFIPNLPKKSNLIRSYKMPTFMFVQALPNIENRYGKEASEIAASCDLQICYRTNENRTSKYFSEQSGEVVVERISKATNGVMSSQRFKEYLLSPYDMNNLGKGEALCIYEGKTAVVTMPRYYEDTGASERPEFVRPSDFYK